MQAQTKSQLTGILYDPLTLLHKCSRNHPERPQRVASIIEHLKTKNLLDHPKVKFVQQLQEASRQTIELVHPKKYVKYVNNLWSKGQKGHLMVLDTYFNEHSKKAAQLAVGGVVEAIDRVVSGQWRNAYAIVRPPGHHSAARNVINGFCVYNNVAIGVKHLRAKHNFKKIAVFDWDVHHGDGTQVVFQEDPNLLFISLHRYDRGSFYPGDSGSYYNNGKGAAKGKQINIGWNTGNEKHQEWQTTPGDNEYIYVFERALLPILKEFKPEFIMISAGFDSARGDPLGGMSVGPDGYYYLTCRLMQLAPVVVALEGGYNLKSISLASEAVVSALIGQKGPNECGLSNSQMKYRCYVPKYYHDNIDQILSVYKQFWPLLNGHSLVDYQEIIKNNHKKDLGTNTKEESDSYTDDDSDQEQEKKEEKKEEKKQQGKKQEEKQSAEIATPLTPASKSYSLDNIKQIRPFTGESKHRHFKSLAESPTELAYYIAGGHVETLKIAETKVEKIACEDEIKFYKSDFPQKAFAPKLLELKEDKVLILENLLYGHKNPCVVDIKMSLTTKTRHNARKKARQHQKDDITSTSTLGFRITNFITPQTKQQGLLFKDEDIIRKILLIMMPTKQDRQKVLGFINSLVQVLKTVKRNYGSTSVLIIRSDVRLDVRWIDFAHWEVSDTEDKRLLWGFENLARFVKQL